MTSLNYIIDYERKRLRRDRRTRFAKSWGFALLLALALAEMAALVKALWK